MNSLLIRYIFYRLHETTLSVIEEVNNDDQNVERQSDSEYGIQCVCDQYYVCSNLPSFFKYDCLYGKKTHRLVSICGFLFDEYPD